MVYQVEYTFTDHESGKSSYDTQALHLANFETPQDVINHFISAIVYESFINGGYALHGIYSNGSILFYRIDSSSNKPVREYSKFRVYEIRNGERIPCEI